MLVYEAIGETLRRLQVDTVFGLLGQANARFLAHMVDACGVRYYGARHETPAVAMADGFARASGRLGVCSVTVGPGVTNCLTGLTEAVKGHTPLLLLAGDSPAVSRRDNHHVHQEALFEAVGAAAQRLRSTETLVEDLAAAVRRALVEQRPVAVNVPGDLQMQACEPRLEGLGPVERAAAARPSDGALERVVEALASARRPAIVAGRGAMRSPGARQALIALAHRLGALLATTGQARGLFAGEPLYVGTCGVLSSPPAVELLPRADVVLAFGASLNDWTTRAGHLLARATTLVQCDTAEAAIGAHLRADVGLVGDAGATAEALLAALEQRQVATDGFRATDAAAQIAGYDPAAGLEDTSADGCVDPRLACIYLDRVLPRERTVAIDDGHFMGYPAMYLSVHEPGGLVFTQDYQAIGLGLASAIGATVARPGRVTVAAVGDGGLMLSLGEIETAVRYRLPILMLVMNDAAYGAEVRVFEFLKRAPDLALFPDADFASVGRALGAGGVTVRTLADLDQVRSWVERPDGPLVVDCKLDRRPAAWFMEAIGGYFRQPRLR